MEPFVLSPWRSLRSVRALRISAPVALALFILLTLAGGARAQSEDGWVATVQGVGRVPVLVGTAFAVAASEFSDVNSRLQASVEQALTNQGFRVDPQAPLQLTYATQATSRATSAGDGYADTQEDREFNLEVEDTASQPGQFDVVEPQVQAPIGHKNSQSLSHYSLDFVVGAPGETPLWTGGVAVDLPPRDPLSVAEGMVTVLVPQIGQTMNARVAFAD